MVMKWSIFFTSLMSCIKYCKMAGALEQYSSYFTRLNALYCTRPKCGRRAYFKHFFARPLRMHFWQLILSIKRIGSKWQGYYVVAIETFARHFGLEKVSGKDCGFSGDSNCRGIVI